MSSYDRRSGQRPKGERTADPLWVQDVQVATGIYPRLRLPRVANHRDSPTWGPISNQFRRALLPKERMR